MKNVKHNEQETAVFRLLREHNRILEAIKLTRDSGVFGSAEVAFLFQLIAWGHCLLLSQYHSGEDLITVSALDQMHVVFALLPWLEVFIHLRAHGLRGYFLQIGGAAEAIYAWGTLMCLCVALPGVLVVETQSYHIISLGTARFLMAQTCLSIFTQNVRFSQMTQTLGTVSGASWPIVLSMSAVTCLYARAAHDIFSDKVIDDYGAEAYFGTYGRSLSTFFRFFVAQGWTAIMYSASNATTEAARLFFISYVLIVSLLLAQLVIGVIVNLFTDIQRLNSEHLFTCLAKFTSTADVKERGAIEDDVLKLNTLLIPLHEASDLVAQGIKPEEQQLLAPHKRLTNGLVRGTAKPGPPTARPLTELAQGDVQILEQAAPGLGSGNSAGFDTRAPGLLDVAECLEEFVADRLR